MVLLQSAKNKTSPYSEKLTKTERREESQEAARAKWEGHVIEWFKALIRSISECKGISEKMQ